jgi:hypothetical protein
MSLNTILRRLDAITRTSLRDLTKLSEVDDDAIELAEALEVVHRLVEKVKPEQVPFGEYGCWDYPCKVWKRTPTKSDVSEVMRQKLMRYPDNEMFSSELRTVEWFQSKGWM